MIRPVRPSAPPPPPTPPRRPTSGIQLPDPRTPSIHQRRELPVGSFPEPTTAAATTQPRLHEDTTALRETYDSRPRILEEATQERPQRDLAMTMPRYEAPGHHAAHDDLFGRRGAPLLDVDEDSFNRFPTPAASVRLQEETFVPARSSRRDVAPPSSGAAYAHHEDSGARAVGRQSGGLVDSADLPTYEPLFPLPVSTPRRREEAREERREQTYPIRHESARWTETPAREETYVPPRRDGSGERLSIRTEDSSSSGPMSSGPLHADEPSWRTPAPPMATPSPMEVPAGFVVGVQPLRVPTPMHGQMSPHQAAYAHGPHGPASHRHPSQIHAPPSHMPAESLRPTHHAPLHPRTPAQGVSAYGHLPPHAGTMAASPRAMHAAPPLQPIHAHPGSARTATTTPGQRPFHDAQRSKVTRFAWFVGGAAFGILFAFLATAFVTQSSKKDDAGASPPNALPATALATATTPPVATIPVATPAPVLAPQPLPTFGTPGVLPPGTPQAPAGWTANGPVFVPVAPVAPGPMPTYVVAPPAQPRANVAPRNPPRPSGRRAATARAGAADDDDAPAPAREKASSKSNDGVSDLLNAGLAP